MEVCVHLIKPLIGFTKKYAVLACVVDIMIALIPEFLLYGVRMRRKTKLILNVIFGLGLITAGLSVGRAATIYKGIWKADTTWRLMPTKTIGMVEEKCGIVFACGPAVRQYFSYRGRVGTALPTEKRQKPNEDFIKMRWRVNLRDIIWFRKPSTTSGRVFDVRPIFQDSGNAPAIGPTGEMDVNAKNFILDLWEKRFKKPFTTRSPSGGKRNQALKHTHRHQDGTARSHEPVSTPHERVLDRTIQVGQDRRANNIVQGTFLVDGSRAGSDNRASTGWPLPNNLNSVPADIPPTHLRPEPRTSHSSTTTESE